MDHELHKLHEEIRGFCGKEYSFWFLISGAAMLRPYKVICDYRFFLFVFGRFANRPYKAFFSVLSFAALWYKDSLFLQKPFKLVEVFFFFLYELLDGGVAARILCIIKDLTVERDRARLDGHSQFDRFLRIAQHIGHSL